MDISALNTKVGAAEGRWLAMNYPNGSPIVGDDGTPGSVLLIGGESAKGKAAVMKYNRLSEAEKAGGGGDDLAIAFIAGFNDVWRHEGRKLTPADAAVFIAQSESLRDQIILAALDKQRFLPSAKPGSASPQSK